MNRWRIAAVIAAASLTLAACGSEAPDDHSGCLLVQTRYGEMVEVLERWQYGNAPNTDMLDALQDLQSGADYQDQSAKTPEFKTAAASLSDATNAVYRAVNTGVGFESAAHDLADASRSLNTVCSKFA